MKTWSFYTTKEIFPRGWLKRQLKLQAEGLCGHLDKVWPDVRDSAWIGGDREGWERVPYWLDGFVPMAYLLQDEDMIRRAKKYIDAILARQKPDGWICPCADEKRATYDTWAIQLITKILVVYYECSGDERIPDAVYRALKNYYELLSSGAITLGESGKWGKNRWYETCISIEFLYERKPESWMKELVKLLHEQGDDFDAMEEAWKEPLYQHTMQTHIVNLVMMLKSEAVSCDLLDMPYTDKAERYHQVLTRYNGMPVGTYTGDECLAGLSPIHGTELCGVVEMMYSFERLFACTGDPKWLERLEVLAFNALPAAISDDMWSHQYDQLSNQIACTRFPGRPPFMTNGKEAHLFGLEPHFGCCTANFGQGWPKFILSTFMHSGDRIIHTIPVASELDCTKAHIEVDTEYPFENEMVYTVEAKQDITFQIRIPAFAEELLVDGKPERGKLLSFQIPAGEVRKISVQFKATPCFEDRPYDLTTVKCGSLIFAVPIEYETRMLEYIWKDVERKFPYCDYEYVPTSDWNYAYCDRSLLLKKKELADIPFDSHKPPVTIKAKVRKIPWGMEWGYRELCAKVPESREPISEETEITLYPYGCAKLRMTELPIL